MEWFLLFYLLPVIITCCIYFYMVYNTKCVKHLFGWILCFCPILNLFWFLLLICMISYLFKMSRTKN